MTETLLDQQIAYVSKCTAADKTTTSHQIFQHQPPAEPDWDTIFADLDLASSIGISNAYKRFRAHGHNSLDSFFEQVVIRTVPGHETTLIAAVSSLVEFDFYQQTLVAGRLLPESMKAAPRATIH